MPRSPGWTVLSPERGWTLDAYQKDQAPPDSRYFKQTPKRWPRLLEAGSPQSDDDRGCLLKLETG